MLQALVADKLLGTLVNFKELTAPADPEDLFYLEDVFYLEPELYECLLNLPPVSEMDNPLRSESIYVFQLMDHQCQLLHQSDPKHYLKRKIGTFELLTVTLTNERGNSNGNMWKIYLPDGLVDGTLRWYHLLLLGHCGTTRLYEKINARFYAQRLSQRCKEYQCPN